MSTPPSPSVKPLVRAWDLPTRLCKWLLALCVLLAWISIKFEVSTPQWHVWNGYAILVLVVFRVLWGFFGGSTARFAAFAASPRATLAYLGAQLGRLKPRYLGHNPLGGWMVFALLTALAVQASLGLYSADQDRLFIEGPLAHTVSDSAVDFAAHWHRLGFKVILVLVSLHIAANVIYDLLGRQGLIVAMITGHRRAAHYQDMQDAVPGSLLHAALCLVAAAAIVFGAIYLLGGNPFR